MLKQIKGILPYLIFDHMVQMWGSLQALFFPMYRLRPLVLRLRITNRCNLSCDYCYLKDSLNITNPDELNFEEWKKIISTLPYYTIVDITGGEPFLTSNIYEILELLNKRKAQVSIISNGFKKINMEKLQASHVKYFMVSLDGLKDTHDRIRGKGSFDQAILNLKALMQLRKSAGHGRLNYPILNIKITYTEENYLSIDELINFLINEIEVDSITLNLLFQNSSRDGFPSALELDDPKNWNGNLQSFNPANIDSMTKTLKLLRARYGEKISIRPDLKDKDIEEYFKNPRRLAPNNCKKHWSVLTMYSDGTLTPCDLGINVGNVRNINYNLKEIYKIKKLAAINQQIDKLKVSLPGCEGCCLQKHELVKS